MPETFFADFTEQLLLKHPEKAVTAAQVTTALKTALQADELINALAEVFRLSPGEVEGDLRELGFAQLMARRGMAEGKAEGALKPAPLAGKKDALRPFEALFRFYSAPDVCGGVELPAALHESLSALSGQIAGSVGEDPFVELYRNGVEDYYRDFMAHSAPLIREEILRLFGKEGPRYLVTTGIGANEQFCHYMAALNNASPRKTLDWIIINSPLKLAKLPADATEENTLFMEFSRSSVTEETIKLHEYTARSCRRIVFSNGGGLKKLAQRDGNLVLSMPDNISGRYGRNKTPILLAPMLAAGMDTERYWKLISEATRVFDLKDPDSLPYVMARFILAFQKERGTDFIYLGCGDDTLGLLADEFIQFWNEGVNKNGNDLLVSRFFGLPRDSHMNLEGVLGNRKTKLGLFLLRSEMRPALQHPLVCREIDPIDPRHEGLKLGDEEVVLSLANYLRFGEVMPSMLLEVRGDLTPEHSAVLGQLFSDVTFVYSRMMGIDPGSNPEVKFVRERSAELLSGIAGALRSGGEMEEIFRSNAEA